MTEINSATATFTTAGIGRAVTSGTRRLLGGRHIGLIDKAAYALVALLVVVSVVSLFLMPYDPYAVNTKQAFLPPGDGHVFGTDDVGRDVLSRMLAGAGRTLLVAVGIVFASTVIGVAVASVASLMPRWLDEAIMRVCDILMALPNLVLALGLAAALGPSMMSIVLAMIATSWPATARLMRNILRETMTSSYVESARILGMTRLRLMRSHVLPNSMDAVYVQASMEVSGTIVMISGLAFLGVGAPPPSPDWGSLIAAGQDYITTAWWIALFPGLAITIAAIAFGLAGDAIRSSVDPASRRA